MTEMEHRRKGRWREHSAPTGAALFRPHSGGDSAPIRVHVRAAADDCHRTNFRIARDHVRHEGRCGGYSSAMRPAFGAARLATVAKKPLAASTQLIFLIASQLHSRDITFLHMHTTSQTESPYQTSLGNKQSRRPAVSLSCHS